MPKLIKRLSEVEVRNAKAKATNYRLYDGDGLRLLIRKSGKKVWQYAYRLNNRENIFTIGPYPAISTPEARQILAEAKKLVQNGVDPNTNKKQAREFESSTTNSVEEITREWHSKQNWKAKHAKNVLSTMEKDVFPVLGRKKVNKVTAKDVIDILKTIEDRGATDVAKRVGQRLTAMFDYAIAKDICENNPALGRSKLVKTKKVTHRPHLKEKQLPEFLKKLSKYEGGKLVQDALWFLLLTFVRPGELQFATKDEFDEIKAEWKIYPDRMKKERPHIVPLSRQALEKYQELKKQTSNSEFLFPSSYKMGKPISEGTLRKALIIMGYEKENKVVPHGFRATASTILNETGRFRPDIIERQLAHVEENKVRAAYNHAEYLEERREMMQWWADYIDAQKA